MLLQFITKEHHYYQQALAIRTLCFFEGMDNAKELLNDQNELDGIHLVALSEKGEVIGTSRININDRIGVISQMAVHPNCQGKGVGAQLLDELIQKCVSLKLDEIVLSARITALPFYEQKGFKRVDEIYPSKKTGILHQNMKLTF